MSTLVDVDVIPLILPKVAVSNWRFIIILNIFVIDLSLRVSLENFVIHLLKIISLFVKLLFKKRLDCRIIKFVDNILINEIFIKQIFIPF